MLVKKPYQQEQGRINNAHLILSRFMYYVFSISRTRHDLDDRQGTKHRRDLLELGKCKKTITCTVLDNYTRSYIFIGEKRLLQRLFENDGILQGVNIALKNLPSPIKFGQIELKTRETVIYFNHFPKIHRPCCTTFGNIMEFDNAIRYNQNVHDTEFY